jgi:hypothetical protein
MGKREDRLKETALNFIRGNFSDMEKLSYDRVWVKRQYYCEPYGDEIEGRSQIVMSDISNTIEWILPSLMKIFAGGENVAELRPVAKEDDWKAKIVQEKVNFDFLKQNDGYKIMYQWFKDALMYKFGVVKWYWLKKDKKVKRQYNDLSIMELQEIQDNANFKIVKVTKKKDGRVVKYDVTAVERIYVSKPIVENVPLEEFIFDISDTKLTQCVHRKRVHIREILKYGLSEEEARRLQQVVAESFEKDERLKDLSSCGAYQWISQGDSEFVWIDECFVNDYDKDGDQVPMKVVMLGNAVLDVQDNSYERPPFSVLTPILIQHRMVGRSIAELVANIQKLRTALARNILDNIYFQNSHQKIVNPFRINTNDLANGNTPDAIVRMIVDAPPGEAIYPMPIQPLGPQVFKFWEMSEEIRENATGITRYNQGLDARSLNRTATGISAIMSASQQRVEMVARTFAETGVKDLFQALVDMNVKYFDRTEFIRVNEQWMEIDPSSISGDYDVFIDVGIGTGTNDVKVNQLTQIMGMVGNIVKLVGPQGSMELFDLENARNFIKEVMSLFGYKNTSKFVKEGGMSGTGQIGSPTSGMQGSGGGPGVAIPPANQALPAGNAPVGMGLLPGNAPG